jgi:hypothetical protein
MPHPDMMFDALVLWATIYLLVALVLWIKTRREAVLSTPERRKFRWPRLRGDWRGQAKPLLGRALEILDDIYVMEWMDNARWTGRVAKVIAVLFITSPVWILGSLWLLLMARLIGVGLHIFDRVFY